MRQFRYQREIEPPAESEGFAEIEVLPFVRRPPAGHTNHAVVVWCDDVLMRSKAGHRTPLAPDDVEIDEALAAALRRDREDGYLILGRSWQPEISNGSRTAADVAAVLARMNALVGFPIDVEYCPHPAGPPSCWCRKPLPGLGVLLIRRHRLDPAQCVYVGSGAADPGLGARPGRVHSRLPSRQGAHAAARDRRPARQGALEAESRKTFEELECLEK